MRCDVGQAVDFDPTERRAFGYVTSLVIGDINIPPDLRYVETALVRSASSDALDVTSMLEVVAPDAQAFRRPGTAAGVLAEVAWNATPTGPITFECCVSPANAQLLAGLAISRPERLVAGIGFTVFDYDPIGRRYFAKAQSHAGTPPENCPPVPGSVVPTVYGTVHKMAGESSLGVCLKPVEGPPGFRACDVRFLLEPVAAKALQLIRLQTSPTTKLIRRFGLPLAMSLP